jgi:hypothetical protein
MSIFNELLYGSAEDAAEILEIRDCEIHEMRAALINALRRINAMERKLYSGPTETRVLAPEVSNG